MPSGAAPSSVALDVLRAALATEQAARCEAEARASGAEAMVAHLKLLIAKLRHERFGASSERSRTLLATILEAKFAQQLPLNRKSESFVREGIELDVSTLAARVGACTATLAPLVALLRAHVLAGERLDTTVPVLAAGRTTTGRLWVYVCDDRPFAGPAPPAALFYYSPDRKAEHPRRHLAGWQGVLQADAYAGFNEFYAPDRQPGQVTEAGCWAHARRKFFDLAELGRAPQAVEAVRRIDVLFAIERDLTGLLAEERHAQRQERSALPLAELEAWMREARAKLSRHAAVARAMDYMLTRWQSFARFLVDGRIDLSNNTAERALRGIAIGRRA